METELESLANSLHINIANPWVWGLIQAILIIVLWVGIRLLAQRFISRFIRKGLAKIEKKSDEQSSRSLEKLTFRIISLILIRSIIDGFPLPGHIGTWSHGIIFVLIMVYVLLALFESINALGRVARNRAPEIEILIVRISKIIVATIMLMVGMRHFNYDIWHIVTALGVGTLAVGLAAQPTLTNMIAGFTILFDRPFRTGDRISISGGNQAGDVVLIGLRSTRLVTTDGTMLIVANSDLMNSRLINYNIPTPNLGQTVKFYMDPMGPVAEIKTAMKSVIDKIKGIAENSVTVYATAINDWALEITVTYRAENFSDTSRATDAIIQAVIEIFKKQDVKFATNPMARLRTPQPS